MLQHTPYTRQFRAALLLALALISYLAVTTIDYPVASDLNDKFKHLVAFLLLAFLLDFAFPASAWSWKKLTPLLTYGLLIELLQYHLPHREFSLWDWLADGLGLLLYPLFLPLCRRINGLSDRWADAD